MNPFRLIAASILVPACLITFGCARESNPSSSPAAPSNRISIFEFKQREIALATYAMNQANEVRRALEESLLLIPNTRMQAKPTQTSQLGCRTYKKVAPDPESRFPSFNEIFSLSHKCIDGSGLFARVDFNGVDEYQIAYADPLPNEEVDHPVGFPVSIYVEGKGANFDARFASGVMNERDGVPYQAKDSVKLKRTSQIQIVLVSQDAETLTYRASMLVDDGFLYSVHRSRREGVLKTVMEGSTLIVNRSTRKVVKMQVAPVEFDIEGAQWIEEGAGERSFDARFALNDNIVEFKKELVFATSLCDLADSEVVVKDSPLPEALQSQVAMSKGKIVAGDFKSETAMKACRFDTKTRSNNPMFAQSLVGLFY